MVPGVQEARYEATANVACGSGDENRGRAHGDIPLERASFWIAGRTWAGNAGKVGGIVVSLLDAGGVNRFPCVPVELLWGKKMDLGLTNRLLLHKVRFLRVGM
jgi:hypothetical protein